MEMPRIVKTGAAPEGRSIDRSIGAMLIDAGKITLEESERILRHSREHAMRFGDAAISLRLVKDEDIRQVLARQFDYPYLVPGQSDVSEAVAAAWKPFSPQVEALRALRSQLLLRWFTGDPDRKTIAIVSPDRADGRTYLAANLAVVFSQMGEKTLLIDADLRNASQHTLFALGNSKGLSTVLADRTGLESMQRVPAFVDLSVLPAGPTPPNPLELLGRATFRDLLKELGKQFDVIIIDTPASSLGSDFQLVASRTLGSLAVLRQGVSRVSDSRDLVEGIKAAGAHVVGTVLNGR